MEKDSKIYVAGHNGMVGSAIVRELKIPVRFVGVGEKEGDIQEFDYKNFALALFSESEKIDSDRGEDNSRNANDIKNIDDTDEKG